MSRLFKSRKTQKTITFYLFIAPWLLGFIALILLPLIAGFGLSLTNYDGLNINNLKFKGIDNYTRFFGDEDAIYSLGRVLLWTALNTPLWLGLSFTLAYILNHALKARGLFRTLFYIPSVIPIVAVAWIARLILDQNTGFLNQLINVFVPGTAIRFLSTWSMYSTTSIAVWTGLGSGIIIFLAGLQGIPAHLEEAATIDGAGKLARFRHVTIPLMTPIIFYQLILSVVVALQFFSLPILLSPNSSNTGTLGVAPHRNVYLFMNHVVLETFGRSRFAYGLALTWILVVVIIFFSIILFRTSDRWVHYETDVS